LSRQVIIGSRRASLGRVDAADSGEIVADVLRRIVAYAGLGIDRG
jgi:hypothetical protein